VFLIQDLCALLDGYLEPEQVKEVYRAYEFGAKAHEGQLRMTGEPYIYHPLAVARILAEMRMDYNTIIAAILHDVIEDTDTACEQLSSEFSEEVATLVDGVTKLTQVKFGSKAEAQAENFRKMILAMVKDIRIILIKLADRLHNMRTVGIMRPDKRRRIARETLEIFAPIANRLGMKNISLELEDLCFKAKHPLRYSVLEAAIKQSHGNRKALLDKIRLLIEERLHSEGMDFAVRGREKHLFSIYQKMRLKRLSFSDVSDVFAFRLVVDKVDTCYRVLGVVHNLYKPVPGKFKDYIAIPKANGYQSLHTVLFSPYGVPIEVQIRTEDMQRVANAGIAAHWMYKTGDATPGHATEWLKGLLEMQQQAGNSEEFLENVKIDLFPDAVYVFTPDGDIMTLPRGATALDFAYAVHTDIGNSCVSISINRHLSPLRSILHNGETVEVITAPGAKPNPVWLDFVVTAKARTNIRHFLKLLHEDEAINLGQRMLSKALATNNMSLEKVPAPKMAQLLAELNVISLNALYQEVSMGNRIASLVARQMSNATVDAGSENEQGIFSRYAPDWLKPTAHRHGSKPLAIRGTEGSVVTFAKCCHPIPGDPILGFVSAGKGIVIHLRGCKNVRDFRNSPERWVDLQWEKNVKGTYPVEIRVDTANQRGVLATVAATIADLESNIENVSIDDRDGRFSTLMFTLSVKDRLHLAHIMRRVRDIDNVVRISRPK
jgi:GTP diphosphokinase / guanosine-3',5'-bis(diphosphate) 3'-diphosphatase